MYTSARIALLGVLVDHLSKLHCRLTVVRMADEGAPSVRPCSALRSMDTASALQAEHCITTSCAGKQEV